MKKLILLLLFIPLFSFSQAKNGEIKTYYSSGKIFASQNFKDDKPHGLMKVYYENGNFSSISNFNEGELDGSKSEYYENGEIKTSSKYENGLLILIKSYDESGKLIKKAEIQEIGYKKTEYVNDDFVVEEFVDDSSKLLKRFIFKNQIRVANYIYKNGNKDDYDLVLFDETNGSMIITVSYVNNEKDGFESFWRDGKVYKRKYYVNGLETDIPY